MCDRTTTTEGFYVMQPNFPPDGNDRPQQGPSEDPRSHIRRPLDGPSDDPRSYRGQLPDADPRPYGGPLITSHIPRPGQRPHRAKGSGGKTALIVILVAVAAVFVGCSTLLAIGASSGHPTPTVSVNRSDKGASTKGAQLGAKAGQSPKPKPKPRIVLKERGSGAGTTRSFRVHGDWDITYSYNCKGTYGGNGYFGIYGADGIGDVYANETGASGKDTSHQHDGPGKTHLEINSTCPWKLTVTQLP